MSQSSQVTPCFDTEDDVAKWLSESGRQWKQKVRGLTKEPLRLLAAKLGMGRMGQKQRMSKEQLAQAVCEKAAIFLATRMKRGAASTGQAHSGASASSTIAAATPEPVAKKPRRVPGNHGDPMPSADGVAAQDGPSTAGPSTQSSAKKACGGVSASSTIVPATPEPAAKRPRRVQGDRGEPIPSAGIAATPLSSRAAEAAGTASNHSQTGAVLLFPALAA